MIDTFSTAVQQDLYETLKIAYTQRILCDFTHVRERYTQANAENPVDILLLMGEKEFSDFTADTREDELLMLVSQIRSEWIKRKRSSVQNALAEAEAAGDSARIETLLRSLEQY